MNEKTFINSGGGWQPNKKIEFDPIFVWPPRPKAFFKWLLNFPGYIWPWNLFFIAIAIICYLFIQPEFSRCVTFKLDWISIIFLRNLFLIILLASFFHIRLHILKSQKDEFQYNPRPLGVGKKWHLGSQTRENMFWTLCSGLPIWTAYEVFLMWGYANNLFLFPVSDWVNSPVYFCLLFLLIPVWQVFHFYITHRFIHLKPIYKWVHFLHHRNVNTGPWSGLSMHPVEHIITFSTVLIHFIIPSHPIHFIFHVQQTGLRAIQGHSGYDKLILNNKTKAGLPNASYFHYLHHKFFECNYGEVTIPLDRWFGSFHDGSKENHEKLFDK